MAIVICCQSSLLPYPHYLLQDIKYLLQADPAISVDIIFHDEPFTYESVYFLSIIRLSQNGVYFIVLTWLPVLASGQFLFVVDHFAAANAYPTTAIFLQFDFTVAMGTKDILHGAFITEIIYFEPN